MQFICSKCNEKFYYPAKLTDYSLRSYFAVKDAWMEQGSIAKEASRVTELSVCPFCQSKTFIEYVEPEADITSVKSVDLAQVDDYLKQGYIVKELYAKTATLVKCVKPEQKDLDQIFKDGIAKAHEIAEGSFKNPDPDGVEASNDNSPENTDVWRKAQEAYRKLEDAGKKAQL